MNLRGTAAKILRTSLLRPVMRRKKTLTGKKKEAKTLTLTALRFSLVTDRHRGKKKTAEVLTGAAPKYNPTVMPSGAETVRVKNSKREARRHSPMQALLGMEMKTRKTSMPEIRN